MYRLLVSAAHKSSGKTTLAIGLAATVPLFVILGIARLLVVALPMTALASPLAQSTRSTQLLGASGSSGFSSSKSAAMPIG